MAAHYDSPSGLSWDETYWTFAVDYHPTADVFRVRPFTTRTAQFLHDAIGTSYRSAWITPCNLR